MSEDAAPTPEETADLLRLVQFTLERSRTSLVANCRPEHIDFIERDVNRLTEMLSQVKAMLDRLPPEEPMSEERLEKVGAVVGAALRKRFGEGSAEELSEAMEAAWPEQFGRDDASVQGRNEQP